MRRPLSSTVVLCYLIAMSSGAFAATMFTGAVSDFSPVSITIQGHAPPTTRPAPLSARIDATRIRVTIDDVNESGEFERVATVADVHPGQQVTLTVDQGFAARIRIRQPILLSGLIARLGSDFIEIRPVVPEKPAGAFSRLSIDPLHVRVRALLFRGGPKLSLGQKDLAVGRPVTILTARGHAYCIDLLPQRPLVGAILTRTASALTIRLPARQPATQPADRAFIVDGSTRFFNEYFGEPAEEVTAADIASGQMVSVTPDGSRAAAVVAPYPAVGGKVVKVEASHLTIRSGNDSDPNPLIRNYDVSDKTKIYLGVARFTAPSSNGHTQTFYDYLPSGKLADINVGDRVSITAKHDFAMSMRVTPTTKPAAAALSAIPSK